MSTVSNSTYLSVPVLDGVTGGDAPPGDSPERRITFVTGPGPTLLDAHESVLRYRRALLVQCFTAGEVDDLYAFVDAQRGRLLPFWLPSGDADLTLQSPYVGGGGVQIVIEGAGYAPGLFLSGASRRHVMVRGPSGAAFYRRIVSASWGGIGGETVDLSASISESLPAGTRLSFLRYCRLDEDAVKIAFDGTYAEATVPVIELPQECPA